MFARWFIIGLLALLAVARVAQADEPGRPLIRTWTPDDYGAHNEIRGIVEDARGVLYAGNRGVILEFDGVTWRKIPAPGTAYSRWLLHEPATDRVWVASETDLGYLERTPDGSRRYVSLKHLLPESERDSMRNVFQLVLGPGGRVYAGDERALYIYRDGTLRRLAFPTGEGVVRLHAVGSRVFFTQRGVGLREIVGEELVDLSALPFFLTTGVNFAATPPDGGPGLVLATRELGLFRWRGGPRGSTEDRVEPWGEPIPELREGLFRGGVLPDGAFCLRDVARRLRGGRA